MPIPGHQLRGLKVLKLAKFTSPVTSSLRKHSNDGFMMLWLFHLLRVFDLEHVFQILFVPLARGAKLI